MNHISTTLTNPNRLASSIYFSEPKLPPEVKRQMQILIEEGFIKCTPLLTLLCDLMRKKNTVQNGKETMRKAVHNEGSAKSGNSVRAQEYNTLQNAVPNLSTVDSEYETNEDTLDVSKWNGSNNDDLVPRNSPAKIDVHALARVIASLQINVKDRPIYLARKLCYDEAVDLDILSHDINFLKEKLFKFSSQSDNQPRRRTSKRRSRRGGRKNKRNEIQENFPFSSR